MTTATEGNVYEAVEKEILAIACRAIGRALYLAGPNATGAVVRVSGERGLSVRLKTREE
ncbi:hypothetical protein LCGC14_1275270 [marine sediment metagenome]|uniref:Uncharacterized protein n=1 Tax=marine sediment metagenome TaxID=412755 RepID=A0A0F9LI57_9ZZZZ